MRDKARYCCKKNQRSSSEQMIDFTKYFFFNESHCFSFSFLWCSQSCLQFPFYYIHLKCNFLCRLINQFIVPLTTITSRRTASSRKTLPLFPGEFQSSEGQHSRNREEMKKSSSAHVCPWQRRSQMRAPLLHTCGQESRVSQSMWRQLENSPESGLIESLSSSLCTSWAVGDQWGTSRRATGRRPGINSWQCLRQCRSVIHLHCEVELRPSGWRLVWDLSAEDRVCEFLVRVGKRFQSVELIEYSVYQVCVCASWGFVVLPTLPPWKAWRRHSSSHTEGKKGSNWMRRKD